MRPERHSYQAHGLVNAAPHELFEALDDPRRLSRHMDERSVATMGGSMRSTTDARGRREIGSVTTMRGRVLGIRLELQQVVTDRDPPTSKTWETVGEPRLLMIGSYRMGFRIQPAVDGSKLVVYIEYDRPRGRLLRLLSALLGRTYAKWCCERMVAEACRAFSSSNAQPSP